MFLSKTILKGEKLENDFTLVKNSKDAHDLYEKYRKFNIQEGFSTFSADVKVDGLTEYYLVEYSENFEVVELNLDDLQEKHSWVASAVLRHIGNGGNMTDTMKVDDDITLYFIKTL